MGYLNPRIVRSRPGLSHGSSFSHRIGVEFQPSTQHKTLVAVRLAGGGIRNIATAGKPCCYRGDTTFAATSLTAPVMMLTRSAPSPL
jgi:hypothetical protein